MTEKSNWIAPARRRQLDDGTAPPETRFYASAWIPPGGFTATSRAEFEAREDARRVECAEYARRWGNGEEIAEIAADIRTRTANAQEGTTAAAPAATPDAETEPPSAAAAARRADRYKGSRPQY
jgi:hypothetical protein